MASVQMCVGDYIYWHLPLFKQDEDEVIYMKLNKT